MKSTTGSPSEQGKNGEQEDHPEAEGQVTEKLSSRHKHQESSKSQILHRCYKVPPSCKTSYTVDQHGLKETHKIKALRVQ